MTKKEGIFCSTDQVIFGVIVVGTDRVSFLFFNQLGQCFWHFQLSLVRIFEKNAFVQTSRALLIERRHSRIVLSKM